MTRADLLSRAAHIVNGQRNTAYGAPEDNFARIAALWSAHLSVSVTATDVALMMVLLKVARLRHDPGHEDGWVDIAGYAACGAEINHAPALGMRAVGEVLGMGDMGDA
jgi:hypothetical protein